VRGFASAGACCCAASKLAALICMSALCSRKVYQILKIMIWPPRSRAATRGYICRHR
jgi:hypothetical protein